MSQNWPSISGADDVSRSKLIDRFDALRSQFAGTARPSTPVAGQLFFDTDSGPIMEICTNATGPVWADLATVLKDASVAVAKLGVSSDTAALLGGASYAAMRTSLDVYSKGTVDTAIAAVVSDTAYDATSWNSVTTVAPSKNAVRDMFEALKNGVSSAYDTLAELAAAFASIGPVTKSVIETGSAVTLSTDTAANVTSVTVPTDGDYDIWGAIHFKGGSSRTVGYLLCSLSSSSATLNTAAERGGAFYYNGATVFAGVGFITVPLQEFRLTGLTAGTVIYLVAQAGFGGSGTTLSAYGSLYIRKRGL